MSRQTIVAGGIGLLLVAVLLGGILYSTRHNRVHIDGEVLKIRIQTLEESGSVVVLDMRFRNPNVTQFVVNDVRADMIDASGKSLEAPIFSEIDAERLFQYYPLLGKKYLATLKIRDKVEPGQTIDRMLAVKVPVSEADVKKRRGFKITVQDLDGTRSEILEPSKSAS